jgi:hypothetical protein
MLRARRIGAVSAVWATSERLLRTVEDGRSCGEEARNALYVFEVTTDSSTV